MLDPRTTPRTIRCTHCAARAVDTDRELCALHLVRWHVDNDDVAGALEACAEHGLPASSARRFARDEQERRIRAEQRAARAA